MKEKINLYVDDLRDCPEGFVIARTVEHAKYYLENFEIAILSLDHDLGKIIGTILKFFSKLILNATNFYCL